MLDISPLLHQLLERAVPFPVRARAELDSADRLVLRRVLLVRVFVLGALDLFLFLGLFRVLDLFLFLFRVHVRGLFLVVPTHDLAFGLLSLPRDLDSGR